MILRRLSVELGSDEHGFVVEGIAPALDAVPAVPTNTLLQWWADEEPDFANFMVATGSQWGPFDVQVQVHDADPGPAAATWEDVVTVSVLAMDVVVIGEIVDGPRGEVSIDAGTHRMRVCARGRSESADRDHAVPDDDEPEDQPAIEHYLVELWPARPAAAEVVRQTSRYARDEIDPPAPVVLPEEGAGVDAAWAIVRDLQDAPGARPIPGSPTTVTVAMELPGTPVHVFNRVRYAFGWPPCNGGSGSPDASAATYHDATLPEYDRYTQVGHVVTTPVEELKPKRIVKRWNWLLPGAGPLVHRPFLLDEDSTVTITVASISGAGQEPRCLVRLVHDGAPGTWADDLARLWRWDLAAQGARP